MQFAGFLLAFVVALSVASTAGAMNCNEWQRLDAAQKRAAVEAEIQDRLESGRGKKYTSVDRAALERCLQARTQSIVYAYDGECSQRKQKRFDDLVTSFIYGCVN